MLTSFDILLEYTNKNKRIFNDRYNSNTNNNTISNNNNVFFIKKENSKKGMQLLW